MSLCLQSNPAPAPKDALPALHEQDFVRIADLAHRSFGLELGEGKRGFVAARLSRLVRELGFASFHQYCDYLLADSTGIALTALAERLTTNHTSFFREPAHLEFLCKDVLPPLRARQHINLWSAGCSSGEEPYSIAISILEATPHLASKVRIQATDISTRMLQRASAAIYTADHIVSIPPLLRSRYFVRAAEPCTLRVIPHVRSMVEFARLNLMEPFAAPQYSAIFCRNVMLYFDRPTHQSLIQRFIAQLKPGGFLFIGHSESLKGMEHSLEPIGPAIYRKPAHFRARSFASVSHAQRTTFTPFRFTPEEVSA